VSFILPTNVQLTQIAQDLIPQLRQNRVIFDIMPTRNVDTAHVEWDQEDNYTGLQQIRGLDGKPTRVLKTGFKRYIMNPGIYGEFMRADETELTELRIPGSFDQPIDLTNWVARAQIRLLQRQDDRLELIGWSALQGTFSVAQGSTVMQTDTFNVQTYTSTVPWATYATATPLNDFRQVQLLHRGHSVNFGAGANAYMNQGTFNNLVNNTNNADLYGRRVTGLATANSLAGVNQILEADNLPTIVIYDQGYLDDTGAFNLYIPTNKTVLIGKRPGNVPIAEYLMTRNINTPGFAPGMYMDVVDHLQRGGDYPRNVDLHLGHNGGPAIYFGSAVAVINS